jgi:pimeloyl-[acyl-carrier protein] methyl ester esterase
VLLHGWGFNAAVWYAQIPKLTPHFTTLAVDLPGYGASAAPGHSMPLDELAETVMEHVPAGAHWLGWSLGGQIAIRAALQQPERKSRLIMISTTICFIRNFFWPFGVAEEDFADLRQALLCAPAKALNRFAALCAAGGDQVRPVTRQLRECLAGGPQPDPAVLSAGLDLLAETDLRPELSKLECPSLWIFGEADRLVSASTAVAMQGRWPGLRTAIIPGAGHAPMVSHPQVLADRVMEFLGERAD